MINAFLSDSNANTPEILRTALDFIPSPVLIAEEKNGLFYTLYANHQFLKTIGYAPKQINDINNWFKIAYPDDEYRTKIETEWQQAIENAIKTKSNQVSIVANVFCADGQYRWFDVRATIKDKLHYITFLDINELELKRLELSKSEEKFSQLSENIPAMIYLCKDDEDWTMIYLNQNAEKVTGYTKEEFLTKKISFTSIYHPEDFNRVYKEFDVFRKKLSSFNLKYRIKHKSGQYRWVEENGAFIKDLKGNIMIEGIIMDIHDKIEAQNKENEFNERLKLATEGTGIGIWDMNLETGLVHWDDQLFKLIGIKKPKGNDFIPDWSKYVHPDDYENTIKVFEEAQKIGSKYYNEFRIIRYDGKIRYLANSGIFKRNEKNEIVRLIGITYDITGQKNHESAIIKLNKELEYLNIQKNKLFSVISHDLRGPVGRNRALLDIIFTDWNTFSKEDIHTHLELIKVGTENINSLLEDLLLWSRTQFDSIKFTPDIINIEDGINAAIEVMQGQAQAKQIELVKSINSSGFVIADANMFKTILRNLIANAIKFSYEKSKIEIYTEDFGPEVLFYIKDYGIGMDKETLREVLSKNSKYTSFGTKGEKGSGLGLSICREFLAKHSKFLKITSKPKEGATFMFALNMAKLY